MRLNAKLSRKEFLAALTDLSASLRQQIEAECEGFTADPEASSARRKQAQDDFVFFRRTYFPHYVKSHQKTASSADDSVLHSWLDTTLPRLVMQSEGVKLAVAAPRGEAKSTYVALFFVLWCIVTSRKHYILLIADALTQAAALLEAVKVELEANPRLAMDFPEMTGRGRVWNEVATVTSNNIKLQALGAGKRMRGLRHGPHRPDLCILDDLENDENVKKPEQRDKLQSWLQRTVLSLGPADDSMDVVYVGTILHYDSVLARTLKKPMWQSKAFKAVLQWPHRMDLWDKWESILQGEGLVEAKAFYDAHTAAMLEGAEVSWPAMRPLYKLMLKRAEDHASFDAEQQNDPLSGDDAPFAKCITFWVDRRADWLLFGAVDPSLGKAGQGRDPSAILVGGLHKPTMTLDVVEASIRKRHPDRIIEDVFAMHSVYHPLIWGVEAVQFQEFFAHVLAERAAMHGFAIPVRPIMNKTDKQLRIETLQPYMVQGRIRLHSSQSTLIDQLRHFPKADHDDGPDALEMLWRIASTGFISLRDAYTPVPCRNAFRPSSYDDDVDDFFEERRRGFY